MFPHEGREEGKENEEEAVPSDPTKRTKKVGMAYTTAAVTVTLLQCDCLHVVQVKSKVAAKGEDAIYQWTIMRSLEMDDKEIRE